MATVLGLFDLLPNVWAGTSISTQADANQSLPMLADLRPAVKWISYEPALKPVDLTPFFVTGKWPPESTWLVIGGESGPNHRTLTIDHVASAIEQCRAAGVPVFVKQDSGPFPGKQGRIPDELWIQEWPEAAGGKHERTD
jgi:protein gp37